MTGVLINVLGVLAGGFLGMLFKKGISKKYSDAVMTGVALCVVAIGISGILKGENILVSVVSMIFGAIVGTLLDIDGKLNRFAERVNEKFGGRGKQSLAEGFVTGSLLFCVGAMAIVGSLEAGLRGDNSTLITKTVLDTISAMMLASALGAGVLLSSAAVLVYQGSIALLAGALEPLLQGAAVAEITCAGSMLIFALGFNMLGVTKIKVANFLPALIFVPFVCFGLEYLAGLVPGIM